MFMLTALMLSVLASAEARPGYWQDHRDVILRSGFDLCWHSGEWTEAHAILGCDGALQPPIEKMTAPPFMVEVPPLPPAAPPAPPRCDAHLSLHGDDAFGFDETRLRPAAEAAIGQQLIAPLAGCRIERIVIRGYADGLGTATYNQRLSERRAEIVAAFLKSRGVVASIERHGLGANEPITDCPGKMARTALIACLSPDRRVTIDAFAVGRS